MSALIGEGHVHHARPGAHANKFRYPIFYLMFPLNDEAGFLAGIRRRFLGVLSVRPRDYLNGKAPSLNEGVRRLLREECGYEAEEIWLQTLPRMFGYGFNPVSFWWCRRAGKLEAVLCEVNNTFGERHLYWIQPGGELMPPAWVEAKKVFHVSPFFPVEGTYRFRLEATAKDFRVNINYHAAGGELALTTSLAGRFAPLAEYSLAKILFRYGWMTPLVMMRIHYQALRLFLKGAKFHRQPAPPSQRISS